MGSSGLVDSSTLWSKSLKENRMNENWVDGGLAVFTIKGLVGALSALYFYSCRFEASYYYKKPLHIQIYVFSDDGLNSWIAQGL